MGDAKLVVGDYIQGPIMLLMMFGKKERKNEGGDIVSERIWKSGIKV